MEGVSNTYNVPLVYTIRGDLNIPALEKSLQCLVARHESLRMSFKPLDGEPYLQIAENVNLDVEIYNWQGEINEQELVEKASRPFFLEKAPLFRAHLWTNFGSTHTLLLNFHHIILDEWTIGIIERELSSFYNGFIRGVEVAQPTQDLDYADYAIRQRKWLESTAFKQGLESWKEKLSGAPELIDLPVDFLRPNVASHLGRKVKSSVEQALVTRLQNLACRERVSLFMVLYAAYAVLLSRFSQQEDIVIGTPIANRSPKDLEDIVGFFVNTMPLRVNLSGNPTLTELLQRIRKIVLDAFTHQDVPFDRLINKLQIRRNASYSPVFQVVFAMENMSSLELHLGDCEISFDFVHIGIAKFDLSLFAKMQAEGLSLELEYNRDLFKPETGERMLSHYRRVLEWMVSSPTKGIFEFDLLTETERQKILKEWNDTVTDYSREMYSSTL